MLVAPGENPGDLLGRTRQDDSIGAAGEALRLGRILEVRGLRLENVTAADDRLEVSVQGLRAHAGASSHGYSRTRMGELGDLLELLHDARNRYRTVRATIREWRHEERQRRAWEQYVASMPRDRSRVGVAVSTGPASAPVPPPGVRDDPPGLARVGPDRIREEREAVTGLEESTVGVRDRDRWWRCSPSQGAL